jgi:hypothetical protein
LHCIVKPNVWVDATQDRRQFLQGERPPIHFGKPPGWESRGLNHRVWSRLGFAKGSSILDTLVRWPRR